MELESGPFDTVEAVRELARRLRLLEERVVRVEEGVGVIGEHPAAVGLEEAVAPAANLQSNSPGPWPLTGNMQVDDPRQGPGDAGEAPRERVVPRKVKKVADGG